MDVWSPTRSVGRLWFDADAVVHCPANTLLAAQVPFGGLYRNVSQQELDLLQLASGTMTQFRAGPAEIMRRELRDPDLIGVVLHHVPNQAFSDALPQCFPARQTQRNTLPVQMSAAAAQSSMAAFTQSGTGTVLM